MMADDDPLYVGRGGMMGDRAGNFAVQNADVILAVGNRLSIRQVGYSPQTWAREAYVMMVDVDAAELKKPTLHVELPIHADAKEFLLALAARLPDSGSALCAESDWHATCRAWKRDYPVVLPRHREAKGLTNPYALVGALSSRLPEGYPTVVGNGTACVVGSHAYTIKRGQRFIINSAVASMGYDLPAAIGVCLALGRREVVCLTGDGSIQMNLQELQTILTNRLPIKILVLNNGGYHSIRQTQNNLFGDRKKVGIGPESGDLSFPSFERLAGAYGYPYAACRTNAEIERTLDAVFSTEGAFLCEIFVDPKQIFEPKSATKRLPDGTLVSPPLEDLAPFLPREELAGIMKIPQIGE
jgi:acetolactate synthase-1/2/3 large subunit